MVKRGDLLKVFFIYLCMCHVVPGHPCGHNPLARFRPLASLLNRDVNYLLDLLRDANTPLYNQLRLEWRLYAECVGLVDTGYFKRSGRQAALPALGHQEHQQEEQEEQAVSREHHHQGAATAAVPAVSSSSSTAGQQQQQGKTGAESRVLIEKNLRSLLKLLQRVLNAMGPTASWPDHSDVAAYRDNGLTGMQK